MAVRPGNHIDGAWEVGTGSGDDIAVHDSADGSLVESFRPAGADQLERAVAAARRAQPGWNAVPVRERAALLRRLADRLAAREDELAAVMSREVGSPLAFSRTVQVGLPVAVLRTTADAVEELALEEQVDNVTVVREPVGVVGAITPWNYPIYQVVAKLAPALAAGCAIVVKPSQVAPLSSVLMFEEIEAVGLPAGVADLLTGTGRGIGEALVAHPDVDMISFTGSTAAGARIAEAAAPGVKRVALELGGKSAAVLLDDADVARGVRATVGSCFLNGGQTCSALTRLVVPRSILAEVEAEIEAAVAEVVVGDPFAEGTVVGPMASAEQRSTINSYIALGVEEGARLLAGGVGDEPADGGYYVRPTVLTDVKSGMRVAQEEIFGPVLVVIPVDGTEEAVEVANDSEYGLSGAVWSGDRARAVDVARRIRTGQVAVNGGAFSARAPFGGVKKSGNGRELGKYGLEEYFELKAIRL
ncbi:aldehyde dehydrogenase family protein [Actinomadura sp. KC345]|uniref:aldehyde dehydrogenase family protein n=1 Tax=Actinomadura sp. KC345 TaxID=2530371 RepID=UPI00104809D2|nr:aldehyde dehydrogenase family protein [Actinomadura sp. KC345]TDC55491.1 aldehyde dehydrogenase family protein [Actinomadura sp. KC345]